MLSCFLKEFRDEAVTTMSLKLFHASIIATILCCEPPMLTFCEPFWQNSPFWAAADPGFAGRDAHESELQHTIAPLEETGVMLPGKI